MTSLFSKLILGTILCVGFLGVAQENTTLLHQSSVKLNVKTETRWSYNFGTEYRALLAETIGKSSLKLDSQHLEFSHNTSYEVGFYATLSLGVMYRFINPFENDKGNEFRVSQQYSYAKPFNAIRLGHRIKVDERIYKNETVVRTRYRIAIDAPLSGLKLDAKEFYGVLSTEALSSFSKKAKPEIDQRFTLGIGYQLYKNTKLQGDIEYRFENYFNSTEHRLFLNFGLIFSM
jgi:hypothetical protein